MSFSCLIVPAVDPGIENINLLLTVPATARDNNARVPTSENNQSISKQFPKAFYLFS